MPKSSKEKFEEDNRERHRVNENYYSESTILLVEEKVPKELLSKIKKIAGYIGTKGMTTRDACLLSDFNEREFEDLLSKYPIVRKLIHLKELEYKRDLLSTLSRKARSGDDKLSMWLLERRFPEEYGKNDGRGDKGQGEGQNVFEKAIVFIQEHGDSSPLVSSSSGKERSKKKKGLMRRIQDSLK